MSEHSSRSLHPVPSEWPSPSKPEGHAPQDTPVAEPGSAEHVTPSTHPPLATTHGSSSAATSWLDVRAARTSTTTSFTPLVFVQYARRAAVDRSVHSSKRSPRTARAVASASPVANTRPMAAEVSDMSSSATSNRTTSVMESELTCVRRLPRLREPPLAPAERSRRRAVTAGTSGEEDESPVLGAYRIIVVISSRAFPPLPVPRS